MKNWIIPPKIYSVLKSIIKKNIEFTSYTTIEAALLDCAGYEANELIDVIDKKSASYIQQLRSDNFQQPPAYRLQSILFILKVAANQGKEKMTILDIGGQLGVLYFEMKNYTDNIPIKWTVFETHELSSIGNQKYSNSELRFVSNLDEVRNETIDIIIAANSIQYIPKPKELIKKIFELNPQHVYFTRFPIINSLSEDIIIIQKSKLSHNGPGRIVLHKDKVIEYPVHLLSGELMMEYLSEFTDYEIINKINEYLPMHKINDKIIEGTTIVLKSTKK